VVLRALSDDGYLTANGTKGSGENGGSTAPSRQACSPPLLSQPANISSGRSTPVPADAPPSAHSISSARKQIRAQSRRLFPTIEYASRVSHLDPTSDYRDFQGFYVLFWIALTIMAITSMLRNIKDTGYPMRVQIWQLFTVKLWELGLADGLMVASTAISLPLHKVFRKSSVLHWAGPGMAIQSIYQAIWLAFWVA
jgi:sterol O-acyltransferase